MDLNYLSFEQPIAELEAKIGELQLVGGGDGFASGFIYGLMENLKLETSVNYGASHGALAMTTPGDTSMVSFDEVRRLAEDPNARVIR